MARSDKSAVRLPTNTAISVQQQALTGSRAVKEGVLLAGTGPNELLSKIGLNAMRDFADTPCRYSSRTFCIRWRNQICAEVIC